MVTLRILLHVMSMLAKLMCALKVTFFMKAGLTEIREDDYEDASFAIKGRILVFSYLKRVPRGWLLHFL